MDGDLCERRTDVIHSQAVGWGIDEQLVRGVWDLLKGARFSSLPLIDRINPVFLEEDVTDNPFVVEQGKIVPDLRAVTSKQSGRNPSIYLSA